MNHLTHLANFLAAHPYLKWDLWPTYGTLGVLLAALSAGLVELRHYLGQNATIDLRRRSLGAFGWQNSAQVVPPTTATLAPQAESRQGDGWKMEARSRRCPEQNGDFFDTVQLEDNHLAFFLGDVSGRGLPAALYQASCKALLRFATFTPGKAAAAVEEVNSILCQRDPDGRFASLVYGVMDLSTGEVELVTAGHTDPILQKADGTTQRLVMPLRLPLGMAQDPDYTSLRLTLEEGDRLLLLTDGVTHARDRGREPLGHERVRVVSHKLRYSELDELADGVMAAVDRYSFRCVDDRTVLALTRVQS